MGRLIDADALIELFEEKKQKCDNLQQLVEMTGMQAIIDAQPTAYSVDSVVAELEHPNNYTIVAGHHYTTVDRAIDIVKRGGVE